MSRGFAQRFTGEARDQVALPIGGLGAGCISLNGAGGFQDFSLRHRPFFSANHLGNSSVIDTAFALLRTGDGAAAVTKLLEGPLARGRIFGFGLKSEGFREGGPEGLPRFRDATFTGSYPFGRVALRDPAVPLDVELCAWNPFVPLDDVASGLPCLIAEYTLRNPGAAAVPYEFSFHFGHPAPGRIEEGFRTGRNAVLPGRGVHFFNVEPDDTPAFGSGTLTVVGHAPAIKAAWLRGWWFDSLTALWRETSAGHFAPNDGQADRDRPGRRGGSVLLRGTLAPGETATHPVVLTWHFPNSDLRIGQPAGSPAPVGGPAWRPFYAGVWRDAVAVADHVHGQYAELRRRTAAFHAALSRSTLPAVALDAITSNLAILKSPTILRQENGNLWGWEGCFPTEGVCHGSCTHVWNYAQALPQLFPAVERTLREQELLRSMDEHGHVAFRAALPDGPAPHDGRAAADGQLGGILKLYRDWQASGDLAWLATLYPAARRSLDYCIRTWDPEERGAIIEPHHNTYDIEFWGADSLCTTIYFAALRAAAGMSAAMGAADEARRYAALAERSAAFIRAELFNGDYLQQRPQGAGLRDASFVDELAGRGAAGDDEREILRREGPKYQYGSGCLSDAVIGAWMAELYGIALPEIRTEVHRTLAAIFRHNFHRDLTGHACLQRPGYALEGEGGLLLCTWPRGGKPTLPFVYSDEVWTGIEYQVASHLILEGLVDEGLEIVRAVRRRYDGRTRNPYNEYECGSFYARAMASFALLPALTGFRYSAVARSLWIAPRLPTRPFRSFFVTATGWGHFTLTERRLTLHVAEGHLTMDRLYLGLESRSQEIRTGTRVAAGQSLRIAVVPGL